MQVRGLDQAPLMGALAGIAALAALAALGALAWPWALGAAAAVAGVAVLAAAAGVGFPASRHAVRTEADATAIEALLDALPAPVLLLDETRSIHGANAAARALFGDGIAGRPLAAAIRDPDVTAACEQVGPDQPTAAAEFTLVGEAERRFVAHFSRLPPALEPARVLVALTETTAVLAAHRQRADFVANVSHELRTPLATLVGFIETLQGPARDDPPARERFLGIMAGETARMTRLVADLLSLAKIEESEQVRPTARADVAAAVRGVADALALQARAKDMRIDLDLPADPVWVTGDDDQLAQVFENLVGNAIKYGKPGTAVTVALRRGPGLVAVAVADRGEGIAAAHLPRLTERFYRVDRGRSRAQGGTGLGLAIVKHIVRRHCGTLAIDSTVGKGSTFTVTLPADGAGP